MLMHTRLLVRPPLLDGDLKQKLIYHIVHCTKPSWNEARMLVYDANARHLYKKKILTLSTIESERARVQTKTNSRTHNVICYFYSLSPPFEIRCTQFSSVCVCVRALQSI